MPIIAAIEHDQDLAGADPPQWLGTVAGMARESHPKHVDGRADIVDNEPGALAHDRVASVGPNDKIGGDRQWPLGGLHLQAGDAAGLFDHVGDLRLHAQAEASEAARVRRQKIEKVPLRHQGDELAMRRHSLEIGNAHAGIADEAGELPRLLMR